MRESQFLSWPSGVLESYLNDLFDSENSGRNLVAEKYAYMMESTLPEEYWAISAMLPAAPEEKVVLTEHILSVHLGWKETLAGRYPSLNSMGRPLTSDQDSSTATSIETYLRGELRTYSVRTLGLYRDYVDECVKEGRNLALENLQHMMHGYGYASLEEAERELSRSRDGE